MKECKLEDRQENVLKQKRDGKRNKHSKVKENRCDGFRKSMLLDEKNLYFDTHCFMLPSSIVRVIAFMRRVHIKVTTVVFSSRKLGIFFEAQLSKLKACPLIGDAN